MRFSATTVVGLKGPLHDSTLLENVSTEKSKPIERVSSCQGGEKTEEVIADEGLATISVRLQLPAQLNESAVTAPLLQ